MPSPTLSPQLRDVLERAGFVRPTPVPSLDRLMRGISRRGGDLQLTSRSKHSSLAQVTMNGHVIDAIADEPTLAIVYALCGCLNAQSPQMELPGLANAVEGDAVQLELGEPLLTPEQIVVLMQGEGMDIRLDDDGNFVNAVGDLIDDMRMMFVRLEATKITMRKQREETEARGDPTEGSNEYEKDLEGQAPEAIQGDPIPRESDYDDGSEQYLVDLRQWWDRNPGERDYYGISAERLGIVPTMPREEEYTDASLFEAAHAAWHQAVAQIEAKARQDDAPVDNDPEPQRSDFIAGYTGLMHYTEAHQEWTDRQLGGTNNPAEETTTETPAEPEKKRRGRPKKDAPSEAAPDPDDDWSGPNRTETEEPTE